MKLKYGPITNKDGKSKDIVVNFKNRKNLKDLLIGGAITMVGMAYLVLSSFKNGADGFESGEYKTMVDLGIIED